MAVGHTLVLETPESALEKAWEATQELCRSLHCEVISADIHHRSKRSPTAAGLKLRVAPEDLKKLFDHFGKTGTVVEHTTSAVDKTDTVIDVESKLRNLTAYRDRLRQLLASSPAGIRDVIEIDRALANVQAELDTFETKRKVLANETEKVSVTVVFRVEGGGEGGLLLPIVHAFGDAGDTLAESIAALISFLVTVIPWLVVLVPLLWFTPRLWRRFFPKRPKAV